MADFLAAFGRANLILALAILAVLCLRPIARRLSGARAAYLLWLVPLFALAALFPPGRQRLLEAAPSTTIRTVLGDQVFAIASTSRGATPFAEPGLWLVALWSLGVAAYIAMLVRNQRWFAAEARAGRLGPAVLGVIAPRIVKPRDFARRFTPDERRLVIDHEHTHIIRQDSRINALVVLVQCLCWFNPLVHFGARALRIDQELACDETVIARRPDIRPAYARALMKAQLAQGYLPFGCYWPSRERHPLLQRVRLIGRDDLGPRRRWLGAGLALTLAPLTGLAAWAAQPARVELIPAQNAAPPTQASGLAPPPEARVARPAPAQTVQPGAGGGPTTPAAPAAPAPYTDEQRAALVATHEQAQGILQKGGNLTEASAVLLTSPQFTVRNVRPSPLDPASARWARDDGHLVIVWTRTLDGRSALAEHAIDLPADYSPPAGATIVDLTPFDDARGKGPGDAAWDTAWTAVFGAR